MQVTDATFNPPFEESDPVWVLRVEVVGNGFEHRATPVVARVGDVLVESIVVNISGDKFVGMLRAVPPVGAELRVGYMDRQLIDTGITFEPPIV